MVAKVDGELPSHLGLVVSYNIEKKATIHTPGAAGSKRKVVEVKQWWRSLNDLKKL
jgi:hypothetical protein